MTDHRSFFRFRVPRLRPSVPPRSATTTQTAKRTPPMRPPPHQSPPSPRPIKPKSTAPPSPTPPIQPLGIVPVPPPEPPVEPSTVPPEPPIEPSTTAPTPPQAPPPPPPHSYSESTQAESSPSSPSQTAIQSRVSPRPPSPSHITTHPLVSAKPPSPSTKSPTTSPTHVHPSPPSLASQPAKKISSLPSSPTVTATKKEASPVITLAGDNRGTSMCIGYVAPKREQAIHIRRRYKVNPDEITDTTSDNEDSSKENEMENDSYINCNIQGINNSMVFNCSITERSPGVHLGSNRNPNNVNKRKRKNMNKVKVNIPSSQNSTVRRRCLRGLFMESSDSELDDPQKPRRHGCRYSGKETSKKDDKMVVP